MPNAAARRDERADAAEADDADGLLEELGARVGAPLPLPCASERVRAGMWRARLRMWPIVSSAAEMMLEVGALTTITPAVVAALMSTLSSPTPARATTFSTGALRSPRRRSSSPSARARRCVGERRQQRGPVGAVDAADVEVRPEGVDRGG
jgi:hypothetical protein